jgi:hypothetical protein
VIEAAVRYAYIYGWKLFPLSAGSKKPLPGTNGFLDATSNISTMTRWWSTGNANIALATGAGSGCWVLDIDAHHGGVQSLYLLADILGEEMLDTRIHRSVNGGMHLIYQWPESLVIPRKINAFKRWSQPLQGIDLLGNDGYAVLPPSRARNELGDMAVYTVQDDQEPRPAPAALLGAVEEILAGRVQGPTSLGGQILAPPKHGTAGMIGWLAGVQPGGQDDAMSWVARALRDEGHSAREAADLLWEAAQQMTLGGRPWRESDIERHVRSAYR